MAANRPSSGQKKSPERQCMGCNTKRPKADLLRVVRGPDGTVSLDFTGRKPGRGAYLCHAPACLKKAQKSGRLARVLACDIPDDVYAAMAEELSHDA